MFLLLFIGLSCRPLQQDKGHRQRHERQVPLLAQQRHLVKRGRTRRRHDRVGDATADARIRRRRRDGRADRLGRREHRVVAVGPVVVVVLDNGGRRGDG